MIEKTNKLIALLNKAVDVLKFFVTDYAKTVERTERISGKIITVARIAVLSIVTFGISFAVYKIMQAVKFRKSIKESENVINSNPENVNFEYHYTVNNEESNEDDL